MILDFAAHWDAESQLSFLEYRQEMKSIAIDTMRSVRGAELVRLEELESQSISDHDRIVFIDDDDWLSPSLFDQLDDASAEDGWLWRSIRIGRFRAHNIFHEVNEPAVQRRPLSDVVFTNNYAVNGSTWKRLKSEVQEHDAMQVSLNSNRARLLKFDVPLSAANKHYCCTVAIDANRRNSSPDDVLDGMASLNADLQAARLDDDIIWMREPLDRLIAVNARVLAQAEV